MRFSPSLNFFAFVAGLAFISKPQTVDADCYMHHIRGSNDRLNEASRDRNNGNRLFDSQNNNRGGVNVGTDGKPYYYAGTTVPIEYSLQHACGETGRQQCTLILQYSCGQLIRDGTTTNTIPYGEGGKTQCAGGYCDTDPQYGRHESYLDYRWCLATKRNSGLFIADQQVGGAATNTRQNPNGDRHGYECPEERDYYPYWRPSMWKDIAIITDDMDKCAQYQAESQNVKPRYICQLADSWYKSQGVTDDWSQYIPFDSVGCGQLAKTQPKTGAQWVQVPAFNIPPPVCVPTLRTRDNHHGGVDYSQNPGVYSWPTYNWTLPTDPSLLGENCVLRIRYNMSTVELGTNYGFASSPSVQNDPNVGVAQNAGQTNQVSSLINTNAAVTNLDVYSKYGFDFASALMREYVFYGQNNNNNDFPTVDVYGSLLPGYSSTNPSVNPIRYKLRTNTNQYGRVFQDRSHVFAIRARPPALVGMNITNIGVRGRRGNIVQTYPSTEYDFVPEIAYVNRGDYIHFQWSGSATNQINDDPNNNDNGPAGTDHSNVVVLRNRNYFETGQDIRRQTESVVGQYGNYYPGLINDTIAYPFLGFSFDDLKTLALFGLNSTYFDLGPRQVTGAAGTYYYMSTRNNNFSNRNQAAAIVVRDPTPNIPIPQNTFNPVATLQGGDGALIMQWAADGTPSTTSNVAVTSVSGPSGYDSGWVYVSPMGPISVVDGMSLNLNLLHNNLPLNTGQLYWAYDNQGSNLTLVAGSSDSAGTTTASINQGGYYAVKNQINGGAIAGIVICIIFFFSVLAFLYWKVRIQPIGGFGNWWSSFKSGESTSVPMQRV